MKSYPSLIVVAMLAFLPGLVSAEAYVIPVDRPSKAGEKLKMAIDAEMVSKMKAAAGGNVLEDKDESWKATLEATQTTVKVGEDGDATELTIEVHASSVTSTGKKGELLPPGTVLKAVVDEDGEEEYTVKGEPVEEETKGILDILIDLSDGEKTKGDENKAFGVDQPRAPGDEWDIQPAELLATLPADMPFVFDPATTKGKMKFVELTGEGDGKTALIQGQVEMAIKGMQGMPPEARLAGSSLTVALDGLFPLDKEKNPTREGVSMIMLLNGTIPMPEGPPATMEGNFSIIRKVRLLE